MALYFDRNEYRRKPGTRSNTKLRVSSGEAPAGQWITDPSLSTLFEYSYGGPGQRDVTVAKGMIVSVLPDNQVDLETGAKRSVLTIARPGLGIAGMAPMNFTRRIDDVLTGNQPSIWVRDFVELPLLRNANDASLVKWGAAYGDIKNGDYLTISADPANFGKLIKFDEATHKDRDIVGQVLETEFDQTPYGWLEWVMWDENAYKEDIEGGARKKFGAPGEDGYGFTGDLYKDGTRYLDPDGYFGQFSTKGGAGIPGITDGAARSQTVWSKSMTVPTGTAAGTKVLVQLDYKNIIDGSVKVTLGGAAITTFDVDAKRGIVTVTVANALAADTALTVNYRAQFGGTPAGWDFQGSVGALKILLKR